MRFVKDKVQLVGSLSGRHPVTVCAIEAGCYELVSPGHSLDSEGMPLHTVTWAQLVNWGTAVPFSYRLCDISLRHKVQYHSRTQPNDVKSAVFCAVTPCCSVMAWRFGGTYRLHIQDRRVKSRKKPANLSACLSRLLASTPKMQATCRSLSEPHGVTPHKIVLFTVTAVRTIGFRRNQLRGDSFPISA
jgi:hypothetical protein